ncbi:hypothetical protein ACT7DH_05555 [Bacillus pacificus]
MVRKSGKRTKGPGNHLQQKIKRNLERSLKYDRTVEMNRLFVEKERREYPNEHSLLQGLPV